MGIEEENLFAYTQWTPQYQGGIELQRQALKKSITCPWL